MRPTYHQACRNGCGDLMEMNMKNIIDYDETVLDLGAASVETKGAALDDSDNIGGQVRKMGIADD